MPTPRPIKVPPLTDPRWVQFVRSQRPYELKCLASRIMYGQVKLLAQRDPPHAARMAFEYFQRNEALAAEDLRTILESVTNG